MRPRGPTWAQIQRMAANGTQRVERPKGTAKFQRLNDDFGEELPKVIDYMPKHGNPEQWAIAWETVARLESLGCRWYSDGRGLSRKDPDRQVTRKAKIKALDPRERVARRRARKRRTIPDSWRKRWTV